MTSFTLTGKKEEGPLGEELLQSDAFVTNQEEEVSSIMNASFKTNADHFKYFNFNKGKFKNFGTTLSGFDDTKSFMSWNKPFASSAALLKEGGSNKKKIPALGRHSFGKEFLKGSQKSS